MDTKQPIILVSSPSPIHLLFYVLIVIHSSFNCISCGNGTDYEALLYIKSSVAKDPYGVLTSWNSSLRFCEWTGVTCGKWHRRVTSLVLKSHGLEGSLSPYIGNLSFLHRLSLTNNSFQGAVPHELGRLYRLRVLSLNINNFSDFIPANISGCSNLEVLDLSYNALVGSISKEISFLPRLTFLSLDNNKLRGGITPFLGNITSMELFSAKENLLGGSIPDTVGSWKRLKYFYLGGCNLSGFIPYSLYNLSRITEISLPVNELTGSLPEAIGVMLPRLVFLQLWGNQLTGSLPPSISNCTRLESLQMNKNKFRGKLTINFARLTDIQSIYLGDNLFGSKEEVDQMKFIDSLNNCTKLEKLVLGNCKFQGILPKSIGNLSNQLQHLYLYGNQLHGNLPNSLGNLVGLERLSLGQNHFTGNIFSTIGNLRELQVIGLYENHLSGQIPDAMGNLTSLLTLSMSSNRLEGIIPSSLGNCQNLLELYLSDNKLNGKVPTHLFQLSSLSKTLDISQNNLSGSLPTSIGDLKMLNTLDLSDNSLSGKIPSSLGDCHSLSHLFLTGNSFQGMVPPSLTSLKALQTLDISHNNLSGHIPKFLEELRLEFLNLSYNNFEGEVPVLGVFANESAFSILGNTRLCGGLVELGLTRCNETNKHTKKFPLFAIVILTASALFTAICLSYACCKKKSKSQLSHSPPSEQFMKVSYTQLLKATNGFSESNLIGNGGFSSVYKGILDEYVDRFVAVKVLHLQNQGAQSSFMRECEAWRSIRHRNLLKIITSCSSIDFQGNDFKALVYEFMPKGSLHDWLHLGEGNSRLDLLQIIKILIDVASALDYIHNHCIPAVVHGDLKPSNILLNNDMVAHIGDFGLARFLGTSYQNSSTGIRGTIGYVAPEYGQGSEMTCNGDIYSLGIVILEVMTGKHPLDEIFSNGLSLHKFAYMAFPDHVTNVVDVKILNIYQEEDSYMTNKKANAMKISECLASILKIGVSCSEDSPHRRMDIKDVLHELQHVLDALQNS